MINRPNRKNQQSGGVIVEGAILFSFVLFPLILGFWDLMMVALTHVRHQSAAVQIALSFKEPALYANIDSSSGVPVVTTTQLTLPQLQDTSSNPPTGFLPKLNLLFNNIMENIGTYSDKVDHNQASELWYLTICRGGEPACATLQTGSAYSVTVSNGVSFFTGPALPGDNCFGGSAGQVKNDFDNYVKGQLDAILAGAPIGSGYPPVGTQTVNTPAIPPTGPPVVNAIVDYLLYKPIVFWASCSLPPRVFSNAPVVTFHTFFIDKELAYQST